MQGLRIFAVGLLIAFAGPAIDAREAAAQDRGLLIQLYQEARLEAHLQRIGNRRLLTPQPPQQLHTPRLDSLRLAFGLVDEEAPAEVEEDGPDFELADVKVVRRLERPVFEERFDETSWTFLGAEGRTLIDTTLTQHIRAALQARFGMPTQILSDVELENGRPVPGENIQFEYWMVVNDSISVRIMDPFGPFDRGIVLAADRRYRDLLPVLRDRLLRPPLVAGERERYIDYFFDTESETWYQTGFNGEAFFTEEIANPRLTPGKRPALRDGSR